MRSGAVLGYRGLVREILVQIRAEQFSRKKVVVVATGGYARLIASQLPEVAAIHPQPDSRRIADRGELELTTKDQRPPSCPRDEALGAFAQEKCFSELD